MYSTLLGQHLAMRPLATADVAACVGVYWQDINCLIEWYLEPLKQETFLSVEDIERLFGNIQEIVQFQKQFLYSLEQAVEQEAPATVDADDAARFKVSAHHHHHHLFALK